MVKWCANCRKTILPGVLFSSIMGSLYHSFCMYCHKCGESLWEKSFVRKKDGRIYCEKTCSATTELPPLTSTQSNNLETIRKANNISLPSLNRSMNVLNEISNTARTEGEKRTSLPNKLSTSMQNLNSKEDYQNYTLLPVIHNRPVYNGTNENHLNVPNWIHRMNNNSNASSRHEKEVIYCDKCDDPIVEDIYTFHRKNFHRQCFTCTRCNSELSCMKKVKRGHDGTGMYCEPCFSQKFGPKCPKCNETVTPYMLSSVFEDQVYHKECFVCQRCKKSLLKDKFYRTGNITICKSCY